MSKTAIRIIAALLCVLCVVGAVITAIPVHADETEESESETTTVVFRAAWNDPYEYASASATICRYEDPEGKIQAVGELSFNLTRATNWERRVELEPGYYKIVSIVPVNEWREIVEGESEVFEVRGDIMTVYCAVLHPNETIEKEPDQWVVHDKVDDTYYIWEEEKETTPGESETVEPFRETRDPGELIPDDPLTTKSHSNDDETSHVSVEQHESDGARIGTLIFIGILVAAVVACGVILAVKRKV